MSNPPRKQKLSAPLLALLCVLAGVIGCDSEQVNSTYGQRKGWGETSLNGTRVLADMFDRAGHKVRSWKYLSPSLQKADVIVWAPDDFNAPRWEVQEWLYYWLVEGDTTLPPRVLIYIGRDYDAEPEYWSHVQTQAPEGLEGEYKRRLGEAKRRVAKARPTTLKDQDPDSWFELDATAPPRDVAGLKGPWSVGVDSTATDIKRHTRLTPNYNDCKVLLSDQQGNPLVSEKTLIDYRGRPSGRLIMIENGSWLLNAPLVNHEHRKLAGKLVDSIGTPERNVVFLESDEDGPPISEEDPNGTPPTGFGMFFVWPIGAVLTQLAALGMVVALMKWPLFGVPRRLRGRSATDFASHVSALGRLLRDGRDRNYAIRLLRLYRQSLGLEAPPLELTDTASRDATALPSTLSNSLGNETT